MSADVDAKPPITGNSTAADLDTSIEEDVGAGIGVVAGAAVGALAGPLGMVVGATLGSFAGDLAGSMLHKHEVEAEAAARAPSGATLRMEHDRLEGLAERVCQAITEGDRDDVTATIAQLQAGVLAHLEGEERDLLPGYAEQAPEDARAILAEHAVMRTALAELELGTDLHTVRTEAVRAFLARLSAHAARENAGLYVWASNPERA